MALMSCLHTVSGGSVAVEAFFSLQRSAMHAKVQADACIGVADTMALRH
jgi:uncharacterized protein YwlG (UPF0340 family)